MKRLQSMDFLRCYTGVALFIMFLLPQGLSAQPLLKADSIHTGALISFPAGSYRMYTKTGFGAELGFNLAFPRTKGLEAGITASYSWMVSETRLLTNLQDLTLDFGLGYKFYPGKKISLTPVISYGGILHLLNEDTALDGSSEINTYIDQTLSMKTNIGFRISERFGLYLTPQYTIFIQNDRSFDQQGHLFKFILGTRFYL